MRETALVFDALGRTLFWHEPTGCTETYFPDSDELWEFLFAHRNIVQGVAHTHLHSGKPSPSQTDVSTFHGIERGLGKKLLWPILTSDHLTYFLTHPSSPGTKECPAPPVPFYLRDQLELWRRST